MISLISLSRFWLSTDSAETAHPMAGYVLIDLEYATLSISVYGGASESKSRVFETGQARLVSPPHLHN